MKRLLFFLFVLNAVSARSQQQPRIDSSYLKSVYDRCLDFDETKIDSLRYYASFIGREAAKLGYDRGEVLSSRLNGIAADLSADYEHAIVFYLQSLAAARKLHASNYEIAALTDLAYVYVSTKQSQRAKQMYLECARRSEAEQDISSVVTAYLNLGAIYNQVAQTDSALYYLNKGLAISKKSPGRLELSSFYNNIGNVYYQRKDYDKALGYFRQVYAIHATDSNRANWWLDNLNLADVFIEKKNYDSGYYYATRSLQIATDMKAVSKQADSYAMLAKLYAHRGDFRTAFDYQQKWYTIDTSLVNSGTNETIASLQEKFHAKEREQENNLLQSEIEKAKLRNRAVSLLALAAAVIAVIIALLLVQKRRANRELQLKNEFIHRQNEKLAELNYEKNSLISIVSHDLSTPFAAIKIWLNILDDDPKNLTEDQLKAIERIRQSSAKGEILIRSILDVEKAETNQHRVLLENFDLAAFVEQVVHDFKPAASGKQIRFHLEASKRPMDIISDKQLVGRICENLFSNAIKYSPAGSNVWIRLSDTDRAVTMAVRDEGVGISKEDLSRLFAKYSRLSSQTTGGEPSTGLGLSIVKRIVDELNGTVTCESDPGKGSCFTVVLKK